MRMRLCSKLVVDFIDYGLQTDYTLVLKMAWTKRSCYFGPKRSYHYCYVTRITCCWESAGAQTE